MNRKYLTLASRIEEELSEINKIIERINTGWEHVKKTGDTYYLDSVALNLHGFYSALEGIFELIAYEVDESVPDSSSWHQDLLFQMKTGIKKVRPAVISNDTYQKLDEYRGFRHVVRNVYTFNLSFNRIKPLVEDINVVFSRIKKELGDFINFLEEVAEE